MTIVVSPAVATVYPGQSYQFTAQVTGGGSYTLVWSAGTASPPFDMTQDGLFTAPDYPVGEIQIRAANQANNSEFGLAAVIVVSSETPLPARRVVINQSPQMVKLLTKDGEVILPPYGSSPVDLNRVVQGQLENLARLGVLVWR